MRRGVAAACLALMLWHGLCAGQSPAPGTFPSPPASSPLFAPAADPGMDGAPVGPGDSAPAGGGPEWFPNWTKSHVWGGVEYLMWMVQGSGVRIPVATSSVTNANLPGAIGDPGTQVLIGNETFNGDINIGMRVRLGFEIPDTGFGIEGSGFMLDQKHARSGVPNAASNPSILAVPFFNVNLNEEAVALIRSPGALDGSSLLTLRTNLSGAEANFGYSINTPLVDWVFLGYRYLNLTEELNISNRFRTLVPGFASFQGLPLNAGVVGNIVDTFSAGNEFNGGQFGLVKRLCLGPVMIDGRASLAFGNTHSVLTVRGNSQISDGAGQVIASARGGLFASRSNMGRYEGDRFSVIPDLSSTLYIQVHQNVLAYVGYSYMFWDNVIRPGEQLDRRIEVQQVPFSPTFNGAGGLQPAVPFHRTSVSIHGLHTGVAIQF